MEKMPLLSAWIGEVGYAAIALALFSGTLFALDGFKRVRDTLDGKNYYLGWLFITIGVCLTCYGIVELIELRNVRTACD